MSHQQPMSDVVILIPGILGSVLVKEGKEVWGASGSSIADNLMTFGKALKSLELLRSFPSDAHLERRRGLIIRSR